MNIGLLRINIHSDRHPRGLYAHASDIKTRFTSVFEEGNILTAWKRGEKVKDAGKLWGKTRLPEKRAGDLMVIKAYDETSYALVMEAEQEMSVKDYVRSPR